MRSAALHAASLRVGALRGVFLLTFLALAARAAHLSIDERGEKQGDKQTSTTIRLEGTRGSIVDRAGVELAISVLAPSIYANPRHFENFDRSVAALARALGASRRELAARLRGRTSFTWVARWVTPETAERVTALDLSGVGVLREPGRAYPACA